MLTVHAEGALLLMSDSQGVKILKIYYRELVIHSNLVVICECQGIDISGSKRRDWLRSACAYTAWTHMALTPDLLYETRRLDYQIHIPFATSEQRSDIVYLLNENSHLDSGR